MGPSAELMKEGVEGRERKKKKSWWPVIPSCVIPPVGDFTTLDLKLECATGPNQDETWPRNEQRAESLDARHSRKSELGVDALN